MKGKNYIREKNEEQRAWRGEQRAKGKGQGAESKEQRAESQRLAADSQRSDPSTTLRVTKGQDALFNCEDKVSRIENQVSGIRHPATKKDSTVNQNKLRFQKESRTKGNNPGGKEGKRLAPVTTEISREEAANTACGFLRFFNN